jgi:hypothetical protein
MPQVLTVPGSLTVTPPQVKKLDALLAPLAECCEWVNANMLAKLTN